MVKRFRKLIVMVVMMVMVMVMANVSYTQAATVTYTSNVHSSKGTYYVAIYKAGGAGDLGTMKLEFSKTGGYTKTTFSVTASCNWIKAYTSNVSGSYVSNTSYGSSVPATKYVNAPLQVYGYCSANYYE